MSAPEILHRILEKTKKFSAKGRYEGWDRHYSTGQVPALPFLEAYVRTLSPIRIDRILQQAKDCMGGPFSALGKVWPQLATGRQFSPELWRMDPSTTRLWPGPDTYCFDIKYRHERDLGDIKYVWELNRLQFLQPAALMVFLRRDTRALHYIEECIDSWYNANPPYRGVAWNSGIEVSLRAISLLVVSTLARGQLSDGTTQKIRNILDASLFWLSRYPSKFSSANNHLIAEAAGEYLICSAAPDLPSAARFKSSAKDTLERETLKQFFSDGVPAEQSPTYGAFSAEFLFLCHSVAAASGFPFAEEVTDRLTSFSKFINWITLPDGSVPAIGDDDEGHVLHLGWCADTYAADIAREFHDGASGGPHRVFPAGGYTVMRDSRWHVVFDHGPLGYLSIAAHGHADALSFCAALDGKSIFVDPGTFLYHSGGHWRDWFRGTRAHNTITIEGANQSQISGPFNWASKASASLGRHSSSDLTIEAFHNGYESRFGIRHHRRLSIRSDGALQVDDRITGSANLEAELVFQISMDCVVGGEGLHWRIIRSGCEIATICLPPGGIVNLTCGVDVPEGGWVSPRFGERVAAPRLAWRGKVAGQELVTVITPTKK